MAAGGLSTGKANMEKFRVIVWCDACRGDEEGCFGGGYELIGSSYETREDAERAGTEYCGALPYSYRVEQLADEVEAHAA